MVHFVAGHELSRDLPSSEDDVGDSYLNKLPPELSTIANLLRLPWLNGESSSSSSATLPSRSDKAGKLEVEGADPAVQNVHTAKLKPRRPPRSSWCRHLYYWWAMDALLYASTAFTAAAVRVAIAALLATPSVGYRAAC